MERTWTAEEAQEWITRRDNSRSRHGLPALDDLRRDDPKGYKMALQKEKSCLLDRLGKLTKDTWSWSVENHPPAEWPAPFSGTLLLPNDHLAKNGFSKVRFETGDNLNYIVHNFYQEKVPNDYPGLNFVARPGICNKRHEYLGPSPRVAGYQLDKITKTGQVEWYDGSLKQMWVGNGRWTIGAYFDETVQGWVSKARGDYSKNNYDWHIYLGEA
ncbi:hypothetical protein BKA70DRAFT_1198620 [Coprinopsis sp. MPI-PUGE-AT-0042]|nr:hypothetical protein BKA70DRAFT_1198620 [Coprinopsis sp. MPI-PUGE-AT-0042]